MPLIIYAKIGTMPAGYIRIKYKRKLPHIGDGIEFKRVPTYQGQKWEHGRVDMITLLAKDHILYYLALW